MNDMPIYSVGLDCDDVVVDTFPNVTKRIQETARLMRLKVPSKSAITDAYDYGTTMIGTLFPGADVGEFLRIADSLDFPYEPVDGAKEALNFLKGAKVRKWMFTGSRSNIVEQKFSQADIDPGSFYFVPTFDVTQPYRKPHKDAWRICAQELSRAEIEPQMTLYVEDSIVNYQQAIGIGLQSVLLLGSPNSRGYQGRVPLEDTFSSMHQLPELVERRGLVPYSI